MKILIRKNAVYFPRFKLLLGKPSLRILNRYQFDLFRRETLVYHGWHNIVNNMRISVSAERYLKKSTKMLSNLIAGIRKILIYEIT